MRALSQLLIAIFCWSSCTVFGQQSKLSGQVAPPQPPLLAGASGPDRRITLDVVATDHSGNPVPGLQRQDFTVLDNKLPRTTFSFRAVDRPGKTIPLQAILLVDAINTPFQGVASQRVQIEKYLRQNGGELPLPTSLVILTDKSEERSAVTRDGNSLADFLDSRQAGLRTVDRAQGFYGDLERSQISVEALEGIASQEAALPGRKLLIWLGPGWPLITGPAVDLSDRDQNVLFYHVVKVSTALREARITLYNIDPLEMVASVGQALYYESFTNGVTSARKVQNGNLALQVFAIQSGGRVFSSANDIGRSIVSCLEEAKAFYTITFDSRVADHPNEYHSLKVKVGKHGLTARTRTGYYAEP